MSDGQIIALRVLAYFVGIVAAIGIGPTLVGLRFIPNSRVGIVEKLWSADGPIQQGHLIALDGEAGYQAEVLRGGFHLFYWRWQYRIHKVPLVVVSEGKIGYVFARDGQPLKPQQTLGQAVFCNHFQDARAFLDRAMPTRRPSWASAAASGRSSARASTPSTSPCSSSSPKRPAISCESARRTKAGPSSDGTASSATATGSIRWWSGRAERSTSSPMPKRPRRRPTTTSPSSRSTTARRSSRARSSPRRSAPRPTDPDYHNNYQDIEAFLRAGGRRGRQLVPLTDGTYFINRWFATVETIPKTIVPIGYVGVVVSYYGKTGSDLSGDAFRHGERVADGDRGVQARTLCPGKYAFNTYAGHVHLVPTTNFVLHWITGRVEESAPLRREPEVDRPGDRRRLRAGAAAVGRRSHRLPEGARASSSVSATSRS